MPTIIYSISLAVKTLEWQDSKSIEIIQDLKRPLLQVFVQQLIFWYPLWWQGAISDQLAFHGCSEYGLYEQETSFYKIISSTVCN